jgi:hypothetical protein
MLENGRKNGRKDYEIEGCTIKVEGCINREEDWTHREEVRTN